MSQSLSHPNKRPGSSLSSPKPAQRPHLDNSDTTNALAPSSLHNLNSMDEDKTLMNIINQHHASQLRDSAKLAVEIPKNHTPLSTVFDRNSSIVNLNETLMNVMNQHRASRLREAAKLAEITKIDTLSTTFDGNPSTNKPHYLTFNCVDLPRDTKDDVTNSINMLLVSAQRVNNVLSTLQWLTTTLFVLTNDVVFHSSDFLSQNYVYNGPRQLMDGDVVETQDFNGVQVCDSAQLLLGVISVCIGKVLTNENLHWMDKRVAALAAKLSIEPGVAAKIVAPLKRGPLLKELTNIFTHCAPARRSMFTLVWETTHVAEPSVYQPVTGWALRTLLYGHMAYVEMIEKYIVDPSHPVLDLPELSSDVANFKALLEDLKTLTPFDKYARVLYNEKELPSVNKKKFPLMCLVAVELGRKSNPKLKSFRVFNDNIMNEHKEAIAKALRLDDIYVEQRRTMNIETLMQEWKNSANYKLLYGSE